MAELLPRKTKDLTKDLLKNLVINIFNNKSNFRNKRIEFYSVNSKFLDGGYEDTFINCT